MADALAKYRAALKRYRKENPKVPYVTAQKRVSEMMHSGKVSGTKKKKRVTVTAAAPRKKARSVIKRTVKRSAKKVTRTQTPVQKANVLLRKIDRLELKRKEAKLREMKDIIQLEINACHDKLDRIKHGYRRKSA